MARRKPYSPYRKADQRTRALPAGSMAQGLQLGLRWAGGVVHLAVKDERDRAVYLVPIQEGGRGGLWLPKRAITGGGYFRTLAAWFTPEQGQARFLDKYRQE